jgi:dTDP-4-dehydrorhamnose reductase
MNILLTGCEGQLGHDFRLVAASGHTVVGHDIDLDITDSEGVTSRVLEVAPDVVVNAAAYTDVDGAEAHEIEAYRVNALGAYNLALACSRSRIPLMHVSTDFVFSGDIRRPYTEFDDPDPRGVYGRSKYAGECYVRWLLDRFYICRTSWLFGVAGGNFVKTMLRLGEDNGSVTVVDDQRGCPTYSRDLAEKLLEVLERGDFGIYHLSNSGDCTWREFAREIFRTAGMDVEVLPISTGELGRPAPRPAYSVMRGLATEIQGIAGMRPYREALGDFILRDLPAWEGSKT